MAASMGPYEIWLTEKLTALSLEFDTDVFVSYIISILDTDSTVEEKTESIEGILMEALSKEESEAACLEILQQWTVHSGQEAAKEQEKAGKDMGDILSEIMDKQTLTAAPEKQQTEEERAYKQAILAQYAQVSDGEEDEEEELGAAAAPPVGEKHGKGEKGAQPQHLERNLNAILVAQGEREQREKNKQEHEKKKEKDKADREAQKKKQQERKDAEKKRTQKGERRR